MNRLPKYHWTDVRQRDEYSGLTGYDIVPDECDTATVWWLCDKQNWLTIRPRKRSVPFGRTAETRQPGWLERAAIWLFLSLEGRN